MADRSLQHLKAKTPVDMISMREELNQQGIVPLARFELIEDLVKMNEQTTKQSASASHIITILSIVPVSEMLKENKIDSKNAAKEVANLQHTFQNISRLFLVAAILILGIGLFISSVLLVKLQNSRYREMGLLSALGFDKSTVSRIIISENVILSCAAIFLHFMLLGIFVMVNRICSLGFTILSIQMIISALGAGIAVVGISFLASYPLIRTEPAAALRK